MKRLRIIVYGRVQRVGYRDAVAELARKLGLKGTVKNLEDEVSVEIIAEGEEQKLKEFARMIHIKDHAVEVEKVEVKEENATNEFIYFKITRGEPNEELGERMDVAGRLLYKMLDKQDQMLGKQDQMLDKQDQMLGKQDQTIGAIKEMHGDMTTRFDVLDQKYGKISATLERISIALETLAGIGKR